MNSDEENSPVLSLLQQATKDLRAGKNEQAWNSACKAVDLLANPSTQYSPRTDYYLAVIFEKLPSRPRGISSNNLFSLLEERVLLVQDLSSKSFELSILAYLNSQQANDETYTAAAVSISGIADKQISKFGSQNGAGENIWSLLISQMHETTTGRKLCQRLFPDRQLSISPVEQAKLCQSAESTFHRLIAEVEKDPDRGYTNAKLMGEAAVLLREDPLLLEKIPRLKGRVFACVMKTLMSSKIDKLLSQLFCFEASFAGKDHTDMYPLILAILSTGNPAVKFNFYDEFISRFRKRVNSLQHLRILVLGFARSYRYLMAEDSATTLETISEICLREKQIPPYIEQLYPILNQADTPGFLYWTDSHRLKIANALINMIPIVQDHPFGEVSFLYESVLKVLAYKGMPERHANERPKCREQFLPAFIRLVDLAREANQLDFRYLDNYLGILGNTYLDCLKQDEALIALDEVSCRYDNLANCPSSVQKLWDRLRHERDRPWNRKSRSASVLIEKISTYIPNESDPFLQNAGRTFSNENDLQPTRYITMGGAFELEIEGQAIWHRWCAEDLMSQWSRNADPVDDWWHDWYTDLGRDFGQVLSPEDKFDATAIITLRVGLIEKIELVTPGNSQQEIELLQIVVNTMAGKRSLYYPDPETVSRVRFSVTFQSRQFPIAHFSTPTNERLPCILCAGRIEDTRLLASPLRFCFPCRQALSVGTSLEYWDSFVTSVKESAGAPFYYGSGLTVSNYRLEERTGLPYIDIRKTNITDECLKLLPEATIRDLRLLPIARQLNELWVAVVYPNPKLLYCLYLYELKNTGRNIRYCVCSEEGFELRLSQLF